MLGNYAFSRVKSKEAFDKGNESLTDAINFKNDLTKADSGWGGWLNTTTFLSLSLLLLHSLPLPGIISCVRKTAGKIINLFFWTWNFLYLLNTSA